MPVVVVQVSAVQFREGAIVLMEDVTERILIDRIRTDFVANVSHELRTPVGAMSILAETLALLLAFPLMRVLRPPAPQPLRWVRLVTVS